MKALNKVQLIGNLGKDPEVRYTTNGTAVTNFSLATSYQPREGQEKTEWHRVTAFGKLAEICGDYLEKGNKAYVEGHLQTDRFEDKNGVNRQITKVIANNVIFLTPRGASGDIADDDVETDDFDLDHDDMSYDTNEDIPF